MKSKKKPTKFATNPLVSFCISTYKRPKFLKKMVAEILKQEYANFEIVICDNDTAGSAKKTLSQFKSKKIRTFTNRKNLGMVDSFNRAFGLSKGDLIVFSSDDDPPYPFMLSDLVTLYRAHPECVGYFGAYHLFTPEKKLANTINIPQGLFSCRNHDWPHSAVKIFSPPEYIKKALKGELFYYLMWSTGFVKREVVEKVGAIPQYGSALMSDRSYCLKVGTLGKMLLYNKELGMQTVHDKSFSLTASDVDMLVTGFVGYYRDIQTYLQKYQVVAESQKFLIKHLINMFLIIKVGDETRQQRTDASFLMNVFDQIAKELPFIQPYRFQLRLMLWQRLPFEILFKALQLSPSQFLKTSYRFLQYRLNVLKV